MPRRLLTEENVTSVADFLVRSGLAKAGYDIVWIDGGWNANPPRDGAGRLVPDPTRFPSGFTQLVDSLHRKGFVGGAWGGWFKRNEYASNSLVGAVGAAEGANGSAWLAVRGQDNAVHQAVL